MPQLVCPLSRGMNGVVLGLGIAVLILGVFPGLFSGLLEPALAQVLG